MVKKLNVEIVRSLIIFRENLHYNEIGYYWYFVFRSDLACFIWTFAFKDWPAVESVCNLEKVFSGFDYLPISPGIEIFDIFAGFVFALSLLFKLVWGKLFLGEALLDLIWFRVFWGVTYVKKIVHCKWYFFCLLVFLGGWKWFIISPNFLGVWFCTFFGLLFLFSFCVGIQFKHYS